MLQMTSVANVLLFVMVIGWSKILVYNAAARGAPHNL